MSWNWKVLDPEYAHVLQAPLFGSIRIERFSTETSWQINWSVPGYSESFLSYDEIYKRDSHALTNLERAKALAEAEITARLTNFIAQNAVSFQSVTDRDYGCL